MRELLRRFTLLLTALTLTLAVGCGTPQSNNEPVAETPERMEDTPVPLAGVGENGGSSTTPMATAEYHADLATGSAGVKLDLSATEDGYLGVSARSDKRLKLQVLKGDITYTYNIASDGTPSVFPFQSGNGTYRIRVLENISEKKYAEIYSTETTVTLRDDFQPYLRPNDYVNYNADSRCVARAAELAAGADSQLDVVKAVYGFICRTVTYDTHKAATVKSGYMPVPDETMATGKGICFDYASLAAAMLRSQGIPTKVIFGYVSPDGLYHAWNMFYTEETGWVTVSYEVSGESWNRLDLTFSAGGADDSFVGDGQNYSDVYQY